MLSAYVPTASPKCDECRSCGLYKECRSPFMRGMGPGPKSDNDPLILVVGEAPGAKEDADNRPFHPKGRSGALIREHLRKNSIVGNIIYTNANRCRPWNNKTPAIKKVRLCHRFLIEEIEKVRPDYILVLGRAAYTSLFKKGTITNSRRERLEVTLQDGTVIPAMAAYHPSFALRERNNLRDFEDDIAIFARFVRDGGEVHRGDLFTLVDGANLDASAEDVRNFHANAFAKDRLVAVDFETNSKAPRNYPKNFRISMISMSDGKNTLVCKLDTKTRNMTVPKRRAVVSMLSDPKLRKVCHNAKYELHCAHQRFGLDEIPNIVIDTMVLHAFLNPRRVEHDLKSVSAEMLGVPDYEKPLKVILKKHDNDWMHPEVLQAMPTYSAMDSKCTIDIAHKMIKQLEKEDRTFDRRTGGRGVLPSRTYYDITMPATYVLFDMEKNGWPIDADIGKVVSDELERDSDELLRKIRRLPIVRRYEGELVERLMASPKFPKSEAAQKRHIDNVQFKPKSPQMMQEILFDRRFFGVPKDGLEKTDSGEAVSVSKENRDKIVESGHSPVVTKFITLVDEWLDLKHEKSNFVDSMLTRICDDGRVRADLRQDVSATRLSSKDPNLHNMKKSDDEGNVSKARRMVCAPKGRMLLEADLSQIELRVLAIESADPDLVYIYKHDEDLHEETARSVVGGVKEGEEVPDHIRRKAKTTNFGVVYRISAYGLQAKLEGTTVDECQDIIDSWYDRFPGVREWQEQTELFAAKYGCVYTLFGRKRLLENCTIKPKDQEEEALVRAAMRQATNAPIQGGALDVFLVCMNKLRTLIKKYGIDAKIINCIHDAILFDVAEEDAERLASLCLQVMSKEPIKWIGPWMYGIPLAADAKVGRSWDKMEKVKWTSAKEK